MNGTLIQSIEKAAGREPPKSHSEREMEEYMENARERALERIAAKKSDARETTAEVEIHSGSRTFTEDAGDETSSSALIGLSVVLAILVVALSVVVIRLSTRNKRMRESSFFNNNVIGGLGKKQETLLWFKKTSKGGSGYQAFLKDLKALVKSHQTKGDVDIELNEAWRDK